MTTHFLKETMPHYSDDLIKSVLRSTKTVAMVGASGNDVRPSYFAMKYLLDKGFIVHPVNPGLAGKKFLGQDVYGALTDVPAPVEMVDIFRASKGAVGVVEGALKEKDRRGLKTIGMQLGVGNEAAAAKAGEA